MTRSLFLKNENYSDVQAALAKADTEEERKRLIWERMKKNGCSKESEIAFRHHCQVCGFVLPSETGKRNPLESHHVGRTQARLLADKIRDSRNETQLLKTY
jgi:hypothetical protein